MSHAVASLSKGELPRTIGSGEGKGADDATSNDSSNDTTSNDTTSRLTTEERSRLEVLLEHKLRGIPKGHGVDISLNDILHRTAHTQLPHIPADIGLAFFLQNRAVIEKPLKEGSGQAVDITRAIFFYRLSPTHQFQRYHDSVRWNLAIFTALLTRYFQGTHIDEENIGDCPQDRRKHAIQPKLSPAATRFMTLYLEAVLEHHAQPTVFGRREAFVRLWRSGALDLFSIHKSWAKKALQREMKRLGKEWEVKLSISRSSLSPSEYDARVAPFVGSLIPGRANRNLATWGDSNTNDGEGRGEIDVVSGGERGEGNKFLDALRVPCPVVKQVGDVRKVAEDVEATMVCNLRAAITSVQSVRPRDMLPVLMRLLPPVKGG